MKTATGSSTRKDNIDSQLQLKPSSFIRNGRYTYDVGIPANIRSNGYYWQKISSSNKAVFYLDFDSTIMDSQSLSYKGYGFSIRCLVR